MSRTLADARQGLALDLTDVSLADHEGVAFLISVAAEARAALRCNRFLTEQLTTASKAES